MFDDSEGILTRIAREDGGCNYRDANQASYSLSFQYGGQIADVRLVINRGGQTHA
jgi:hypothetical protein